MKIILNVNHDVLQYFRKIRFKNLLKEGREYKFEKKN